MLTVVEVSITRTKLEILDEEAGGEGKYESASSMFMSAMESSLVIQDGQRIVDVEASILCHDQRIAVERCQSSLQERSSFQWFPIPLFQRFAAIFLRKNRIWREDG